MKFKSEKQRKAVMAMLRKKGLAGKPIAYERKGNFNHVVMKPASVFKAGSFRTIDIGRKGDVKAIIGKPKGSSKTLVKTFLIPIKGGKRGDKHLLSWQDKKGVKYQDYWIEGGKTNHQKFIEAMDKFGKNIKDGRIDEAEKNVKQMKKINDDEEEKENDEEEKEKFAWDIGGKMGMGSVFKEKKENIDKTQIQEAKKEELKQKQEEQKREEEKLKQQANEWKRIDDLAYNKRTGEIDRLDALSTRELMKRGLEDKDLKDSYGVEDELDKGGTRITVSDIKGGKSVEEKVASHKEKAEQHANEQKKWIIRDSPDEWTDIGNNLLYNKRTGAIKKVDFNPDGGKVEDVIFKRVGNAETGEINLEKTMQPVGRFDKNTNTVEINVAEIARRSKDEDDFVKNLTNVDAHEHIHSAIHDESPSNPKSYEEFRNRRIKEDKA